MSQQAQESSPGELKIVKQITLVDEYRGVDAAVGYILYKRQITKTYALTQVPD